jgi:uncharacterized protein (DUF1778 family)
MTKEKKDCRLNIRITPSFKAQLEKAAEQDNRTVANFVISVLQERLDTNDDCVRVSGGVLPNE